MKLQNTRRTMTIGLQQQGINNKATIRNYYESTSRRVQTEQGPNVN